MNNVKNFALIGVAGYIAPRHIKAIKETNNELIATLDPFDSVGYLDSVFPNTDYFYEFERFERHIDKLSRTDKKIDYVSICSPNYLHDSHIRFALRHKANAICEKPLVLNPWNIDALAEIEKETENKIFNILQLRLHPSIISLKQKIDNGPKDKIYDIDLAYITSRGRWYDFSWKGNVQKSGGVATNIGVHFFDMLTWIFGDVKENIVHIYEEHRAAGYLQLENARVRWFLSIDYNSLPDEIKQKGQRTYRSITVEGEEIEFSSGFTDLHTLSYQKIIKNEGFGLSEARNSIQTVYNIRNSEPKLLVGDYHPLAKS
ncbi:MAG TPA: Gfo/Idh/MocA family oxidoreductase [Bacteroidales bacterium]|jgi:UDP-N-acetyl-2-amino-2-deoxyglucuronate dehydrogenase|nr:Gfo/Idh/MocA family oxidoreductase [Bacteroidales bacterium]MDD4235604.1 Gfo/Idh/MocA family oxidoreductase [Bacteroidales bacterium]MDY0159887.1 Gfo/Idh/MocA family oxidoreductase [Bacteroidales bacterium]HRW20485.1 Gfo/Idh/MocA family oxidoreductase [Bacteroidales bacterium]HXK81080.1 Gfo/Idh/MocA family oxidoreductase [Bacteroidales bacterium]